MEKRIIPLILAVFSIVILITGNNLPYVYALAVYTISATDKPTAITQIDSTRIAIADCASGQKGNIKVYTQNNDTSYTLIDSYSWSANVGDCASANNRLISSGNNLFFIVRNQTTNVYGVGKLDISTGTFSFVTDSTACAINDIAYVGGFVYYVKYRSGGTCIGTSSSHGGLTRIIANTWSLPASDSTLDLGNLIQMFYIASPLSGETDLYICGTNNAPKGYAMKIDISTSPMVSADTLISGNTGTYTSCEGDSTNLYASQGGNNVIQQIAKSSLNIVSASWKTISANNMIRIDNTNGRMYVTDTSNNIYGITISDASTVFTTAISGVNNASPRFRLYDYNGAVYIPLDSSLAGSSWRLVRDFEAIPPDNSPTGGIDCTLPQYENILQCRLGGTGAFGSAGNFIIGQAPTNTTDGTGLTGIGCAIGLVDCVSNPDIKTNGLGLLIFIASIFIVVGMFIRTQGMEQTKHLPVYMWAMIIIALSAFFTITNIIEPVFLIISIIGLIALGAPKLANTFKGGSTFGSGSTE